MSDLPEKLAPRSQSVERGRGRQALTWFAVLLGALASLATPAPDTCPQGMEEIRAEVRVVFVEPTETVKLRVFTSGPCAVVEAGAFDIVECPREPIGDGGYGGIQLDPDSPGSCGELCTCGQAQDETFCVARRGADSVDVVASLPICPGEDNEDDWVRLELVSD